MKKVTKKNLKTSAKVFGRLIIAGIMCAVVFLSMSVLGNGLLAREVGYCLVKVDENNTTTLLEEYYFKEGETLEGLNVETGENEHVVTIREMSSASSAVINILSSIMMLFLLGVFPYNMLWELGSRDENKVRYKHKQYDPLRGVKIGLVAAIPSALLYIFLWVGKVASVPSWALVAYCILNTPFRPYINAVISTSTAFAYDISVVKMLLLALPLLFAPVVCWGAYLLGYRQFSIKEHLTYTSSKAKDKQKTETDTEI